MGLRGAKNKEKRKRLAHIIAGMVILLHAFERYESGHDTWQFFLPAGLVFLSVAMLHHVIERRAPWIDGLFIIIEAMLSFIIAYEYFHAEKKLLPWCYVITGIGQLVLAFVMSRKGLVAHRKKHGTPVAVQTLLAGKDQPPHSQAPQSNAKLP